MKRFLCLASLSLIAVAGCASPGDSNRASPALHGTYLTADFAVPPVDPDDYYDVAAAVALHFDGIVLDHPTPAAEAAIREIGGNVVLPSALAHAARIVTVGAATHAAQYWRPGMRVVVFAGDAALGAHDAADYNVRLDPVSYLYMRARSRWVPTDQGGLWKPGPNASFTHTTDQALLTGTPIQWWFAKYFPRGQRNLWGGALLHFAFDDNWLSHSVASGRFVKGWAFDADMLNGERELLMLLPARPVMP
jgi:hypothetical protein